MKDQPQLRNSPWRVVAGTVIALLVAVGLAGTSFGRPIVRRGLAFIGFAAEASVGTPTARAVPPSTGRVVPIFYSALGPDNDELHLQEGTHRLMIRASMGEPSRMMSFELVRLDTRERLATPLVQNRRAEYFEVTFEIGEYELVEPSFPDQPVHITISKAE